MERFKRRVVAAGLAGAALALGVSEGARAEGFGADKILAGVVVHLVYAVPSGPEVTTDLVAQRLTINLGKRLAPRKAGPVVAAPAGSAVLTAKAAGKSGLIGFTIRQALSLREGRHYCLAVVQQGREHRVLILDVTDKTPDVQVLPKVCGELFARWIP